MYILANWICTKSCILKEIAGEGHQVRVSLEDTSVWEKFVFRDEIQYLFYEASLKCNFET